MTTWIVVGGLVYMAAAGAGLGWLRRVSARDLLQPQAVLVYVLLIAVTAFVALSIHDSQVWLALLAIPLFCGTAYLAGRIAITRYGGTSD